MKTVRFVMAIHNHQPMGNFDDVIRRACRDAYHPFLDVAERFPDIRMAMHVSGPLFEWAERNDRHLLDRLAEGAQADRFEILGGGLGEPILTMLPDADVQGQIDLFRRKIARTCGVTPRGIWLPERVWEPYLASVLADAGVRYTIVDDFHFHCAGLRERDLCGYYVTEDRGRLLRVFSGSEQLRYAIPFHAPEDTIATLRRFATEDGRNVIVYADDGEKFGLWPETHKHVYEDGWLSRFFTALNENRDWIRFSTFAEVLDELPPRGRIWLPEASYREMTEWVLPRETQETFEDAVSTLKEKDLFDAVRPFMRGGLWRNFKAKYIEAARMYARMMEVSATAKKRFAAKNIRKALRALYRGQCNCAYWHGVFGGLYMPFLRFAVYQRLLEAENLLEPSHSRPGRTVKDFDLDGRDEIKLHNKTLACYLKPDSGGVMYELDDRRYPCNLSAVMTRRPEAYHRRLVQAVQQAPAGQLAAAVASIHERVRWKEPGIEKLLHYDPYVRDSLIDHFHAHGVLPEELKTGTAPELGDFVARPYSVDVPHSKAMTATLRRTGRAGRPGQGLPVELAKRVQLRNNGTLSVRYVLGFPEGAPDEVSFAMELNLGLMAGNAPDRNYFSHERENLGNLSTLIHREKEPALGLVDEWLGIEVWLRVDPVARFIAYPVETVNNSEGGFERVYQGSAVLACWALQAEPGEENVFNLEIEVRHS